MTNIGGEPGCNSARALLGDILNANLDQPAELDALRDWVRHALRFGKRRDSARGDRRDALFGRLSRARIDYRARKHSRKFNHGAIHLDG
ncbi:MAG: hypothetical protein ABR499_02415 [Gemmatimonadaceae bacterium]